MTATVERLEYALAGRYHVQRELGAGGMATVFLAEDLRHHRLVALKVLRPEISAVVGAERFLKEIEVTANLQHPHLLPLFDSGEAAGLLFYVMPFVPGETLRDKITREKQLSIEVALRITTQVASALDYAHKHEIIHRDIKPENILLHEGQALIADFGIGLALRHAGGNRLTETGLSLGTPQYMSPEQAAGDRTLDGRTDIYSLGCVLYEMLAGEPPHTGPTVQAVIAKLMAEPPRRLTALRPTVPAHVEAAVHVALAKLPADRFDSAGELSDALLHSTSLAAHTFAAGRAVAPTGGPWLRDRRTVVALGALTVVAAAAMIGWAATRVPKPSGLIHLALSFTSPPRLRSPWTTGVRLSRDGRRLAYYTGRWQVIDLASGTSREAATAASHLNMVFSPSGDSLAMLTTSWLQQIFVLDLATGHSALLTDSAQGRVDWSSDGWIYHRDLYGSLRRVRVADGRRETLLRRDWSQAWSVQSPVAVPGGRGVIFTRYPKSHNLAQAEIAVLDLRTREHRSLVRGIEARLTSSGHLLIAQDNGSLLAARFDSRALRLLDSPVAVLEGLETFGGFYPFASFEIDDNGTLVYVRGEPIAPDTVIVVDRDGRRRATHASWGGWVNHAARSRDGRRWAASVHRTLTAPNIWVMGDTDRQPRRLTFGAVLDYHPQFLPGGRQIAFSSPRAGKNWDLYSAAFDGSSETIVLDRPGDIQWPRFTTDGRWVVFCERDNVGQTDVVAHRFGADSRTFTLANTEALECGPDVSPDGRWLAYHSDESGRNEIYVRPFPSGGTRWQISTNGGSTPRWSSSSRELFYVSPLREVMMVPVVAGAAFTFGAPSALFALDPRDSWSGEVLPGDREFIVIRRRLEAPGQVFMIRTFFEVLRSKAGR